MKQENDIVGLFVVFALVLILGLFGWTSERDYEYQKEIANLRQELKVAETECTPPIDLSMPVDLESIQL